MLRRLNRLAGGISLARRPRYLVMATGLGIMRRWSARSAANPSVYRVSPLFRANAEWDVRPAIRLVNNRTLCRFRPRWRVALAGTAACKRLRNRGSSSGNSPCPSTHKPSTHKRFRQSRILNRSFCRLLRHRSPNKTWQKFRFLRRRCQRRNLRLHRSNPWHMRQLRWRLGWS